MLVQCSSYETFLYVVAALMKTGSYKVLHEIFTSHYLRPKSERYGEDKFDNFGCFYGYSETLQTVLAPKGQRLRRLSRSGIDQETG